MSFVSTHEMLLAAQASKTAVGAFNIENMEMAQAVIEAAESVGCPVIIQTTSTTLKYAPPSVFVGIVAALAKEATVPVALHLDHGSSVELAIECMKAGYTSVMYDGSALSFDENLKNSKRLVESASAQGITVEAELGSIGGKEDEVEAENAYTDPQDARVFAEGSGVDSLAVAIGTAHGIYAGTPVLDMQRLADIKKLVNVPLVLHGASGLSEESIKDCIRSGICKVNFATDLRIAYSDGIKGYLKESPKAYDPKTYGKAGLAKVKELAIKNMKICNLR